MTDCVDEIVLRLNDQKWPATEAQIREYGAEQYRLGFLDGEASALSAGPSLGCDQGRRHEDALDVEACPV